jgi:uncharacterized membrane protein
VRKSAGFSALAFFVGGVAAIPFSIGPGKGHNFGPLILASYLWIFAMVALVVFFIASARVRRERAAGDETTPGESTAG